MQNIFASGHYVLIIERMIKEMLHFEVVFWIMFLPFPFAFFHELESGLDCSQSGPFSNPIRMIHDTFFIVVNLFDITHYMDIVESPWLLGTIHILFVLAIPIMMFNFLIALFANAVAEVTASKDIAMMVQRLSIVFILEWRFQKLLQKYYVYMSRHCIHFLHKGGKVYLVSVESIYDVNPCFTGDQEQLLK